MSVRAGYPTFTKQVDAEGPSLSLPEVDAVQRYYLEMARRGQAPTTRTRADERAAFNRNRQKRENAHVHGEGCRCGNPACGYIQ